MYLWLCPVEYEATCKKDIYAFMYFFSSLVDDIPYQYIILDEQTQTTNKTWIFAIHSDTGFMSLSNQPIYSKDPMSSCSYISLSEANFLCLGLHFQFSHCFTHSFCKIGVERTIKISQIEMNLKKIVRMESNQAHSEENPCFCFLNFIFICPEKAMRNSSFSKLKCIPEIEWSFNLQPIFFFKCFSSILLTSFLMPLTKRWDQSSKNMNKVLI